MRAFVFVIVVAGLLAISIAATSLHRHEVVLLGQSSGSASCADAPAAPRDVEVWEHDSGILVQWETCPDHYYQIRWRLASEDLADPIDWPNTTSVRGGEFDIPDLQNGRRYIVQLRPVHIANDRRDSGRWIEEQFATPRRCSDLPEIPSDIVVRPGDSRLTVSWSRCVGSRSEIRWRTAGSRSGSRWQNSAIVGSDDSFVITGLENGTDYDIQLRSFLPSDAGIISSDGEPYRTDWSDSITSAPTAACPDDGPVVPDNFVVVPGNAKLFVSWRPCPDHEYELAYRLQSSDPSWPSASDWRNVGVSTHTIQSLLNGSRYELQVRSIRDGSRSDPKTYFTSPSDPPANNRSPTWDSAPDSLSVIENRRYDTPIAIVNAEDSDGRRDQIRYELAPEGSRPSIFPFSINAATGEIYMYGILDYESIEEYTLIVRAIDLSGVSISREIRIEVVDAEGPPPPILSRVCSVPSGVQISWNRNNSKYSYELQRRPDRSGAAEPRWINTPIASELNMPRNTAWVFRVRAIEKSTGEQSKWSSEEVVFVGGEENTSPKFRSETFAFELLEEQPAGAHVGYALARDEDRYSSLRYRIFETTPKDAPFEIDPFTGTITTTGRLDFEELPSYTLVVGATDLCGASDYADAMITVIDNPDIDVVPLVPNPPALIERYQQVVVVWPTNFKDTYDLDWRELVGSYRVRPRAADATMPTVVELPKADTAYAFRLRRVNPLGVPGDWSEESIVNPSISEPRIPSIEAPRQGQVLGEIQRFLDGVTLREGQSTRLGFNVFDIEGQLDNTLLQRDDITVQWRATGGEFSDDRDRAPFYTAPDQEGLFTISATVVQRLSGGIKQSDFDIPVHVIGDAGLIKPFVSDNGAPRNIVVEGTEYVTLTYSEAKEYRPTAATKALFKIRQHSVHGFDWVGVHIAPSEPASSIADRLPDFTLLGNLFTAQFVHKSGHPIINMSFTNNAALCLPVPAEYTDVLEGINVMRLAPDGTYAPLSLPVRFQPNPTFNDPALVCGHSEVFDGQLFLAISNSALPTATPIPTSTPAPTETPVATETPVPSPTPPAPTATPTPVLSPTVGISISTPTSTSIPTASSEQTTSQPPTATSSPEPTSVPTNTPMPTSMPTAPPTEVPTATAIPTSAPTATPSPMPKATDTPTSTPTPTPTSTHTPTPSEVMAANTPTSTPVATDTPTPIPATSTPTVVPADTPMSDPTVVVVPTDEPSDQEQDEDTEGLNPFLIFALLAFLLIGSGIVTYTIMSNRAQRNVASSEEDNSTEPEEPVITDTTGATSDQEVSDDDDDRYEKLRIDA